LLFLVILFTVHQSIYAQENDKTKFWKKGGSAALSFSQVSLSNWSAGGENAVSANSYLNLFANYKKGKSTWDNILELAYGMVKLGEENVRKSDDKIDFASKYGQLATGKWYYTAMLGFKSQFTDGFNYPNDSVAISRLLAPAYLLYTLGMDFKPNDNFSLLISPITGKTTIVNDQALADAGAFGVDPLEIDAFGNVTKGKKIRNEFGAFLKMFFKKPVMENVNFQTKLELFSSYTKEPQNVDVNWETMIEMKINKFLTASINTNLIYDHDIQITDKDGNKGPRTQFKEVFGIGISYKF
ncbi:DUF3078 domain-containing protein, partial [candidate division KSB1 bacterium]